jgi:alkylated DNA repair dioxygenase AlkB
VSESLSDRCVAKLLPLIELNHVKEAKENPKHANQPLFAFFSNPAGESYTYFQTPTTGLPFSDELKELATIAETLTGEKFTKAFGNVYLNGQDHIPPHRDTTHGKDHIVSFSFYESRPESQEYAQEVRTLVIESNSGQVVQIIMEDASAVIMKPGMQLLFKHSVPPSTAAKHRRLNITLRV